MLLHAMGVLGNIWMILDRWHWFLLYVLCFFFALIPFIMEISVIIAARLNMKQTTLMKAKLNFELKKNYDNIKQEEDQAVVSNPAVAAPPQVAAPLPAGQ